MRGPIVLAMDNRFAAPRKAAVHLRGKDGVVSLLPVRDTPKDVWMAFQVPFEIRQSHVGYKKSPLTMVDFASAGNQWTPENVYRVWLPQPLFLQHAYPTDTWRLNSVTSGKELT